MLEVRDFTVSYGESEVVHQVGFEAGEGEILAVMGRNGMGKSTLFKSLIGILPSRGGSVKLCGQDLAGLPSHERVRKGLAYVPQGRMVFPALTVMENVLTGLRNRKDSVPEEIFSLFPIIRDMANRKAGNLSGGQQQQLVIARALVTNPKVLLLDEPTEGIQPSIIKDLARLLVEIKKLRGLTIVVSEQVLSFALDVADRLLVIERGHIVDQMTRANADSATLGRYLSV
ncbi:MAG: urea ABC transporter ATP-binding subunit UrtE [Gammaproteobacteria bacterium]|nr:urea ABC transporter ATP-binding subunit UrtE [Gammaproteobacteria bacterium]